MQLSCPFWLFVMLFLRSAVLIPVFVTFQKLYFVQQLIVSPFDGTIRIILTNLKMGCL